MQKKIQMHTIISPIPTPIKQFEKLKFEAKL